MRSSLGAELDIQTSHVYLPNIAPVTFTFLSTKESQSTESTDNTCQFRFPPQIKLPGLLSECVWGKSDEGPVFKFSMSTSLDNAMVFTAVEFGNSSCPHVHNFAVLEHRPPPVPYFKRPQPPGASVC